MLTLTCNGKWRREGASSRWSQGNDRSLTEEVAVLAEVHAELRKQIPLSVQVRPVVQLWHL